MIQRQMGMLNSLWMLCLLAAMAAGGAGAAESPADVALASDLFQRGDVVGALPVYERLAAAEPANVVYAERLTICLAAQLTLLPAGKEREELLTRIHAAAERATALGSKNTILPGLLAWLQTDAAHTPDPQVEELRQAETAFGKGDLDGALVAYKAIAAKNPGSYAAHLYAGDVYYRKGDLAAASEWFGKAIAINPNVETAYRYWGDALAKAGDDKAALPYYIRAVVAEPYNQTALGGLRAWAKRTGAGLQPPQLPRPQVGLKDDGTGKGAQPSITLDQNMMSDKRAGAAWLAYAMNRIVWMRGKYLERNRGAAAYRHSLEEEVESLRMAAEVIQKDLPDAAQLPALRDLVRLSQDGMLEPYVLLNGVDQGIAQDYPAYREGHREQIAAFIDKYLVARPEAGK